MQELENEIFEVWKMLDPSDAYLQGLDEYAGKMFVPTKENQELVFGKIDTILGRIQDETTQKFLNSLKATLKYREPPQDISNVIWTFFGHLVKEGINPEHVSKLLDQTKDVLSESEETYNFDELPLELKIISLNNCNGLKGILNVIKEDTVDQSLRGRIDEIITRIDDYKKNFVVEGIEQGDFSEVFPILKEHSKGDLGRKGHYPQLIKDLYDYYETPDEIEKKALTWLENELPDFQETAKKLAEIYGSESSTDVIDKEVMKHRSIPKSELLDFILSFRDSAQRVVERQLVRINPNYSTKVMETPNYLVSLIPTAAMTMFDSLTDKPFNIFFVTTDEKRSPSTSLPSVFQMIVHEEYGHCVNFSNSALGFAWKPSLVENLNSPLHYPISEGISFHRELESQYLLEALASKPKGESSQDELRLLSELEKHGDLKTQLLEFKFVLLKWRITRFLRAIGDVRINMNKQSVTEFVEWASEKTGLSKKTIYDQIFIFIENPGYAPCYSIAGMALKSIQDEARSKGKDILEFNTIVSSLGFPPRSIFEERLRNI